MMQNAGAMGMLGTGRMTGGAEMQQMAAMQMMIAQRANNMAAFSMGAGGMPANRPRGARLESDPMPPQKAGRCCRLLRVACPSCLVPPASCLLGLPCRCWSTRVDTVPVPALTLTQAWLPARKTSRSSCRSFSAAARLTSVTQLLR